MIIVAAPALAQTISVKKEKMLLLQMAQKPLPQRLSLPDINNSKIFATPFLSPAFYSMQLGFFCKQEIKFDKLTKIPFRFRLGSVEECDRLEGKGKRN